MKPPGITTIEISKEYLHFNSAHFTLFSASAREDLHGHTFYVTATIDSAVGADGLAFDYNLMKKRLAALCDYLDEKVLLPEQSPYLRIAESDGYIIAHFADERIPFLPRDVRLLPLRNITVEELAPWFLAKLRNDPVITALDVSRILIRVSSGPGQWAGATWLSTEQSTEVSP
ncbi:MAG: 6-pyruvoyl trahydropterin synthase family protein [Pseudomonadales bacterium]